ncbi:PaaI family thioesterase [Oceanicoccus sagamiensis]|uniref:Thioesterase n=1 Tax=Oceanicoccus sagamiensis TaxID=716816 RepID=A0A1X9NCK8_9GAMM|nr:PaaI family thioesterase [Oceanicoccus sagamiensis]ARN73645.1 thioesterase [Oceanicoccus sagamiensis]
MQAIQDKMQHNHCYGCGPENEQGLQLKSYRREDGITVATFIPAAHHNAGPKHFLNGGIQATILDCHGICAALGDAYYRAGRDVGEGEMMWYATGHMAVSYQKPVPVDQPVELTAEIVSTAEKKTEVSCQLLSGGEVCATAEIIAVKVPNSWYE